MDILMVNTDWSSNEYRQENNEPGGIGYYRIVKPAEYMDYDVDVLGADFLEKKRSLETDDPLKQYKEIFGGYDLVVTKMMDNINAAQLFKRACEETDTPYIVDLDDNHFEVRDNQPAYDAGYQEGDVKRAVVGALMSFAEAIFVTTEPLKEYYENLLENAFDVQKDFYILPNCNDMSDFRYPNGENDKLTIGWHGSTTHDDDLAMVAPVLNKVLTENQHVEMEFVGGLKPDTLTQYDGWTNEAIDSIKTTEGTPAFDDFPPLLMSRAWDIGIAPLIEDEFNRGKSAIKWMEYSMKGIPTVASDYDPYSANIRGTDTIVDGSTGLLCDDIHDWQENLEMLIENKELREEIGENAYDFVVRNWQYSDHIDKWDEAIEEVASSCK